MLFCFAASLRWAGLNYCGSHSTAQLAAPQSLSTQFSMEGLLCSILTRTNALEVQTANILSSTRPPIVPQIPSLSSMGLRLYRFHSERACLEHDIILLRLQPSITAKLISFVCSRTLNCQANELTLLCKVTLFS